MSDESAWYEMKMDEEVYKEFVTDELMDGKLSEEQREDLKQRKRECVFDRDAYEETKQYNVFCVSHVEGWINVDATSPEQALANAEQFLDDADVQAFYHITKVREFSKEVTKEERP